MEFGIKKSICLLLDITQRSYSNWKNEKKPIIEFCEKYLNKNEIDEFLKTNQIQKLELIKHIDYKDLKKLINENSSSNIERFIKKFENFKRSSIVHFYFLLRKPNIKNKQDVHDAIENAKYKKNIFQQYLKFEIDFKNDNVNFQTYANDLLNDINNNDLNDDDFDFIFKNRDEIITILIQIAEKNR